ncbi:hypothetical protein WJX73_008121 [Symbiochloris irregularis]|uniref:ENT domain-containing protein n=1 Tax=Symbiochloris irregularis TaxID=706552 RepID=A0AAW1PZJ7_9CHLO
MVDHVTLRSLEQDAYYAVMTVMACKPLDWAKERMLSDLREELHISGDDHRRTMDAVLSDDRVRQVKADANSGRGRGARAAEETQMLTAAPTTLPHQTSGLGRGGGRVGSRLSTDGTQKRGPGRPPLLKTQDSFREPERRGPGRPPGSGRNSMLAPPPPQQPVSPTTSRLGRQKRSTTFFDDNQPTPVTPFAAPAPKAARATEDTDSKLLGQTSRGGTFGSSRGRGRGKQLRGRPSTLSVQPSTLSSQMAAAQVGKGAARMQRVPFLPDLFDSALAISSIEELEGLHAQLEAREKEIAAEMDVARRLEEDIPDFAEVCELKLRDMSAREAAIQAEMADCLLLEEL